jgi:hypothetical protein
MQCGEIINICIIITDIELAGHLEKSRERI